MDETAEREFREYIASRHAALFRVALLLAGHRQDAEDLLQTVLAKLALHWGRASKSASVDAYVRKVLYHQQVSWWRSRGRRPEHVTADPPDASTAGDLALAVLIAIPVLTGMPVDRWSLPFVEPVTGSPCESATDEAEPPVGVPEPGQPSFVRVFFRKLPPRDDYFLQSAYGMCPAGYAVINLGPNREHGHVTITIQHETSIPTCATLSTPRELIFCEDATATTPLVQANTYNDNDFQVTAIYSDGRSVSMEAIETPFTAAALKPVVTDPELADQLP